MKYFRTILTVLVVVSLFIPCLRAQAAVSGSLVKGASSTVYYVTAEGNRLAFPNEATYFTWYKNFDAVNNISDAEVAALPLTGLVTMRPGVAPVKIQSDPKIYAVAHGGTLRELVSNDISSMIYGNDWQKKVVTVPEAFFTSYKTGAKVSGSGQYWWKQEVDNAPTIASDYSPVVPAAFVDPASAVSASATTQAFSKAPRDTTRKKFNLVVGLWNPHDPGTTVTPTKDSISQMLFSDTDTSVKGFYRQTSGGAVDLADAGVFGWYDADKPYTHYWAAPDPTDADGDGFINGHNEKWAETILKIDKEFDFRSYDANHDGVLTPDELGVLIVIPTMSPFGTNRVVLAQEYPAAKPMVVDGEKIGMIAEWYTGDPPNMGVVAHELSHLFMNTTDMYLDSPFRAANLSLMDGSYCNCDIDPWQRIAGGKNWLDLFTPNGSGNYELSPVDTSYSVMKLSRPGKEEFFLVEYRDANTYQSTGTPGLLIWDILNSSTAGDWGRDNIHLLRANGGVPLDDNAASYRGTSTAPASTGVLKWFDGTPSGISLTEIGAAGATIKFKLNLNTRSN